MVGGFERGEIVNAADVALAFMIVDLQTYIALVLVVGVGGRKLAQMDGHAVIHIVRLELGGKGVDEDFLASVLLYFGANYGHGAAYIRAHTVPSCDA